MLDFESCQSLEKLVLDREACGSALSLAEGIELREDPILPLELMQQGDQAFFPALAHQAVVPPGSLLSRTSDRPQHAGGVAQTGRQGCHPEGLSGWSRSLLPSRRSPSDPSPLAEALREIMEAEARRFGMEKLPDLP